MSSSQAINELSSSKKRYDLQDRMLQGFADNPDSTAKEICRSIGLQHEEYCDGPKRAHDLKKLGKIIAQGDRECRITKKQAEYYRVAVGARFVGRDKRLVVATAGAYVGRVWPKPRGDSVNAKNEVMGLINNFFD